MKPYYSHGGVTLYHGNCLELLPSIEADVVVTDPPYGTGGWRRTAGGEGSNPSGQLVREAWDDGAVAWLGLCRTPAVLAFWPAGSAGALLAEASRLGLDKVRALYMRKLDPKPQVGGRTRWGVEPIWALSRDGFLLYGGDDLVEASTPRANRDADATGHPYQKPLEVMTWLIAKTREGTVLDPFAGSGTTLVAAKELGRKAIGIEADERWCEVTAKRLSQEVFAFGGAA